MVTYGRKTGMYLKPVHVHDHAIGILHDLTCFVVLQDGRDIVLADVVACTAMGHLERTTVSVCGQIGCNLVRLRLDTNGMRKLLKVARLNPRTFLTNGSKSSKPQPGLSWTFAQSS